MTSNASGRRWSIYFLFLFAILAMIVMFGSSWLADTARKISEKKEEGGTSQEAQDDPEAALVGQGAAKAGPDDDSLPEATDPADPADPTDDDTKTASVPATHSSPIDGWSPQDVSGNKPLVQALRSYLDLRQDLFKTRKAVQETLATRAASGGPHPLTDMRLVRWLVAQSRSFGQKPTSSITARRSESTLTGREAWGTEIKGKGRWMHVREADAGAAALASTFPRAGPWPLLLALHAPGDEVAKEGAGKTWLERHWPRASHPAFYRDWHFLMPIAKEGRFSNQGVTDPLVHRALRGFWPAYHMDFDRLVLDGGDDALLHAVTTGRLFLAGLVLRDLTLSDGKVADTKMRASLPNLGTLPVYAVDRPDIVHALEAGGHDNVVSGGGGDALLTWMRACVRKQPRSFDWVIRSDDQRLAYWVNIDSMEDHVFEPKLSVRVRDNTIEIEAKGPELLTLYLDDDLVDLDAVVRVRVNGTTVIEDLVPMPGNTRETTGRDLRRYFEQRPIDVRKFRYYGWLKSAYLAKLRVP